MKYAIDVSNYSGTPTLDTLREIVNSERIERICIGIEFPATYSAWYDLAQQLGLEIHAWRYLYNPADWERQLYSALTQLGDRPAARVWLDTEDQRWRVTQSDIDGALDTMDGENVPTGIYTGEYVWRDTYGNPQAGQRCPLWLARWGDNLSFDVAFGGWDRASMVQYRADYRTYGITMDMNVYE